MADEAADLWSVLEAAKRELERATHDLEAMKKERDDAVRLPHGVQSDF